MIHCVSNSLDFISSKQILQSVPIAAVFLHSSGFFSPEERLLSLVIHDDTHVLNVLLSQEILSDARILPRPLAISICIATRATRNNKCLQNTFRVLLSGHEHLYSLDVIS